MKSFHCTKPERVYVKVTSDFDATGYMQPRAITWEDGRIFAIDIVKDFRPSNTTESQSGDACYTVMIKGQKKLLFFERTDPHFLSAFGRWYILR